MNSKYQTYRSNPKLNNYIKHLTNDVLRDPKYRKGTSINKTILFDSILTQKTLQLQSTIDNEIKRNEIALFRPNMAQIKTLHSDLMSYKQIIKQQKEELENYDSFDFKSLAQSIKGLVVVAQDSVDVIDYLIGLCFHIRNNHYVNQVQVIEVQKSDEFYSNHYKKLKELSLEFGLKNQTLTTSHSEIYDKQRLAFQSTVDGCSVEEKKHLDLLDSLQDFISSQIETGSFQSDIAKPIQVELSNLINGLTTSKVAVKQSEYVKSNNKHRTSNYNFILHLLSQLKVEKLDVDKNAFDACKNFDDELIKFNNDLRIAHLSINDYVEKFNASKSKEDRNKFKNKELTEKAKIITRYLNLSVTLSKIILDSVPQSEIDFLT
ncbi:hypothetical protein OTK51_13335 [Vibrio scophthalmi]|uniref:hypothetical protein n=1 Tax=Vibrio scophthalmi TaxID=45658 RepID=UPI002283B9B6|nr:hypothetical protein [Vibrio scophthalmi]MCY9804411.1 hypothetical protein [Vibrio scophthalmi]